MVAATAEKHLTPKQEMFVDQYLRTSNGTESALAAGYSPRSAAETSVDLLKKPHVLASITAKRCEVTNETKVTVFWVIQKLTESAMMGLERMPVWDKRGNDTGLTQAKNQAAANKALELLGKHLGMFIERIEVEATVTHKSEELADFTIEELKALSTQLALQAPPTPTIEVEFSEEPPVS